MRLNNKNRNTTRLPGWDYAGDGMYFITFVTQNRMCVFGEIVDDAMAYNAWGKSALEEWHKSFEIRKELFCDEFIIMPNHLHAIVKLFRSCTSKSDAFAVGAHGRAPLQQKLPNKTHRKPKSLSSFAAGYKSSVTSKINDLIDQGIEKNLFEETGKFNRNNKLWQRNYHDHIIRDKEEYWKIKHYIRNNPSNWVEDRFHPLKNKSGG